MSQLAFDHLLNLSLSFHVRRKTGEVLRILDRGAAINRTLEVPTLMIKLELCSLVNLVAYTVQHHSHVCRHCYRTDSLRFYLQLDTDRCHRNRCKRIQCVYNLPLLTHTKLVPKLLPPSS